MLCGGIDIGGHTITAGTVDISQPRPAVVSSVTVPTPAGRDIVSLTDALGRLVQLRACPGDSVCAGLAVPGFISKDRKQIIKLTNFAGCDGEKLGELLAANMAAKNIRLTVLMENDANCAALGEGIAGAAVGLTDFIVLTLGTGIGGGIVTDWKLLRGAHGMGGECGHIVAGFEDFPCRCGAVRHLESAASADWVESRATEAGLPGDFRKLWKMRGESALAAAALVPAIESLAQGIASLAAIFDPQAVILTGGMSHAAGLCGEISARMQKYLSAPLRGSFDLQVSALGADAAVIGAASLFRVE